MDDRDDTSDVLLTNNGIYSKLSAARIRKKKRMKAMSKDVALFQLCA